MRFFPVFLFFFCFPSHAADMHAACRPLPLPATQGEPDGWLLLAALLVCAAGRLAAHRPK